MKVDLENTTYPRDVQKQANELSFSDEGLTSHLVALYRHLRPSFDPVTLS